MKIKLEAKTENLSMVTSFCREFFNSEISPDYHGNLLLVAVEEVFVNISSYAYKNEVGCAQLELTLTEDNMIRATFTDKGAPFNPIEFDSESKAKDNLDALVPGGLGLHIVKSTMKNLRYEYTDGCNVFSFEADTEEQK